MMNRDEKQTASAYFESALSTSLSRRSILRRSVALGLAVPGLSALLAACGGDDDGGDESTDETDDSAQEGETEESTEESDGEETEETEEPEATEETGDSGSGDTSASLHGDAYEEPQNQGGQIIEGTFSDAATVNAILTSDTASSRVIDLLTRPVIDIHPLTVEPIPEVAESFEISDDGLEYTFYIREDVTWHDGEQVTAGDVKFTFDLHMAEGGNSPRFSELTQRIESIEVVDDYTVAFTLTSPTASFLASNMVYGLVPEHILADVDPAELDAHPFSTGEKGTTIGCGAFQFEEWVKDDHVTLVKYDDFFKGSPNIDQWIFRIVPDQTVIVQQLRTGELDYGPVQESFLEDMESQENVDVSVVDTFSFTFFAYQLNEERTTIFQEQAVRQALFYGLDRQAMIDAIRFGVGQVAVGTMPVRSWAYNPDGIELKYEYDPDRAGQMLDDAGWVSGDDGIREKDGQRLAFEIYTNAGNEIREQYVAIMQEQWREIGVECTPRLEEWNAFLDRITGTRDFETFLVGFSWDVDPDQSSMWHTDSFEGGFNMNGYSNPDVDELLMQGLQTTDQEERTRIYTEMQNIIMQDLPSPILDFPQDITGVNVRVHNFFPGAPPSTEVINAHEWWVDPA